MDKIIVKGGNPISGKVSISGSKNASLPILAASLLSNGPVLIKNLPDLTDIKTMTDLLSCLGFKVAYRKKKFKYFPSQVKNHTAPYDLVRTMRASILVLGPLLAKWGKAVVSLPGGCAIGARPVNFHLQALSQMGAEIKVEHGYIHAHATKLKGTCFHFDQVSVTGTENIVMAASLAEGTTVITNAAKEPEVSDLVFMLNKMGAKIRGAGTSTITIEGVSELGGCEHTIMPDRIEAGTFLIGALMTRGNLVIEDFNPKWLGSLLEKLEEAGAEMETSAHSIRIKSNGAIKPVHLKTEPYPGFPTDFQAQFMALMSLGQGVSMVEENIFENRFMHVAELLRMGADIRLQGNKAMIHGVPKLSGAPIMATDLRASACLVLAGLAAEGITEISRVYHIDRGYEFIEKKFRNLGAKVKRIKVNYRF